jgi:cyclopropane fatty-acyl-phospholipid synthase-like methyltransferase
MTEANHVLYQPAFPRSNKYDPDWVIENQMGPNALWLVEWLCEKMDLKPEMRVLDLGCGTAMTSVFLAREFGVRVWANDLWINPDDNWRRVQAAGAADRVFPLRAEAHALPFPREFFDAAVSMDSYQYYGTDDLYLSYLSCFVRPGGKIGVVVPGLTQPIDKEIPEHLTRKQANGHAFWEDDLISFHTAHWWRSHWERSNRVDAVEADSLPDGWKLWRDFEVALEKSGKNIFPSLAEALEWDGGRYIDFVRLIGVRKEDINPMNLYDAGLIASLGGGHAKQH